jgi:hypothetical protein
VAQEVVVILGCRGQDPAQPVRLFLCLCLDWGAGPQFDAGSVCQFLQGGAKIPSFPLHHEGEDVAPLVAGPEAVPVLAIGEDDERGRLFGMKRTQSLIVLPRFLERDVGRYDLDDVETFLDLVNHTHR